MPKQPRPDPLNDERMFRTLVIGELLILRREAEQIRTRMEILMSASSDLQAAAVAIDDRIDALRDMVTAGITAVLAAITAIVAGQNPDGSVSAAVANQVVADMQAHLTAAEAKVGELGPAVVALDAAVHPASPPVDPNPPA